jgi:hypothetical protein
VNRQQRRATAAEKRRAERRSELITLAANVLADMAEQDSTLTGATLVLPDGEVMRLDADLLARGGRA